MKIINNIEDLMRIYRVKDLLTKNEIEIDFINLIANYIGEDYSKVKKLFIMKEYEDVFNDIYTKEQKEELKVIEDKIISDFIIYLKYKIGVDILEFIKVQPLYLKEEKRYIKFPILLSQEKYQFKNIG